ncbi:hypothetical protein ACFQVD_21700 [Streptosporangium amethystogenes subsp. fukuiense]|uniref:Transposase n=1 Tax=Streptosporangium amethystogenes subsp. fukuiense TaxID=698418 RepID=A0ABW2T331_9ACTN
MDATYLEGRERPRGPMAHPYSATSTSTAGTPPSAAAVTQSVQVAYPRWKKLIADALASSLGRPVPGCE